MFNQYLEGINYFFENRFNSFLNDIVDYVKSNNGLLVIFADHGEEWDDFSYGHYNSVDRGVLTLPVIFYDPANGKNSKIIQDRISSVDIGSTLIEIITGEEKTELSGCSQFASIWEDAKVKTHDSFSQIWRTRETFSELLTFQKQAINSGKIPEGAKEPYLEQEAVYWDNLRLHCIYNGDDSQIKKSVEKSGAKIKDKKLEQIGLEKLQEYNKGLDIKKGSNVVTNFSIRVQLNAMGYNV